MANLTKKMQYKEIPKLKFIHTCFVADHLSLHSHSMVSFFYDVDRLFSVKAQSAKRG